MDHTSILLSNDTNSTEKIQSANEIINNNNLPLSANQILSAHEKIRIFMNNYDDCKILIKNRTFILNKLLNINIRMYIEIILALCGDFNPENLNNIMVFYGITVECIENKGDNLFFRNQIYIKLLDYYEFDISDMPNISDEKLSYC